MEDDDTLPGYSPPGTIEDTDVSGLCDNPAATTIFNEHVYAMDKSYHDFKTSMLRQLVATQGVEREEMVQLQAQNKDLERKLAISEKGRVELEEGLEAERTRLKTALEEAGKWKTQYEGMKSTLQGVLSQPF